MADIVKYDPSFEQFISNPYLQRLQNPTDPAINKCYNHLFIAFCKKFGNDKENFKAVLNLSPEEMNKALTVTLSNEDLGFDSGKNPERVTNEVSRYLDFIYNYPFVVPQDSRNGKESYMKIRIIKGNAKTDDGHHTVVFNDLMYYVIFPKERYGRCSLEILKEMGNTNPYAVVLYQEGCSRQFDLRGGRNPWFDLSERKLRLKFLFDKMDSSDEKFETYTILPLKGMRIDKIRSRVLKPALQVIEDFFNAGKISFWLNMAEGIVTKVSRGRPKKTRNFHFQLEFSPRVQITDKSTNAVEGTLFLDSDTLQAVNRIKDELTEAFEGSSFGISKQYIMTVCSQLKQRLESENPDKELPAKLSSKICAMKTRYGKYGPKAVGRNIVNAFWEDFQLGTEPKNKGKISAPFQFWPDSLEEKIALMQQSSDFVNKAAELGGIGVEEVISLLGTTFLNKCRVESKPLKDWEDATSFFTNWLKYFIKNRNKYGNEQQRSTSSNGSAAFDFFNEPAEEFE
mgnify:FL=1